MSDLSKPTCPKIGCGSHSFRKEELKPVERQAIICNNCGTIISVDPPNDLVAVIKQLNEKIHGLARR